MENEETFFTFGYGHTSLALGNLRNHYWVGNREKMFELRGPSFAMEYPMSKLEDMAFEWNLREASDSDIFIDFDEGKADAR